MTTASIGNNSGSETTYLDPVVEQDIKETPVAEKRYSVDATLADRPVALGNYMSVFDAILQTTGQTKSNPFEGELQKISPDSATIVEHPREGKKKVVLKEPEISVLLDSGLQAKVSDEGIRFDELNNGQSILAWHSVPVGEVSFEDLQAGSIGPGGDAAGIGSGKAEDGFVDTKTQQAMTALYDALENADLDSLSPAQRQNVDKVMEQIRPFLSIEARTETDGKPKFGDLSLNNIQANDKGGIELDYSRFGAGRAQVSLEGNQLDFQMSSPAYFFSQPGFSGQVVVAESVNLTDPKSWDSQQLTAVKHLQTALENVDTDALTADEKANIATVLEKIESGLEARTTKPYSGPYFESLDMTDKDNVKIDYGTYIGSNTATVKGDKVHVEYFTSPTPSKPGESTVAAFVRRTEVLDLNDVESWTPKQQQVGKDLKAALENSRLDGAPLKDAGKEFIDNVLEKMKDVPVEPTPPVTIALPPSLYPVDILNLGDLGINKEGAISDAE